MLVLLLLVFPWENPLFSQPSGPEIRFRFRQVRKWLNGNFFVPWWTVEHGICGNCDSNCHLPPLWDSGTRVDRGCKLTVPNPPMERCLWRHIRRILHGYCLDHAYFETWKSVRWLCDSPTKSFCVLWKIRSSQYVGLPYLLAGSIFWFSAHCREVFFLGIIQFIHSLETTSHRVLQLSIISQDHHCNCVLPVQLAQRC